MIQRQPGKSEFPRHEIVLQHTLQLLRFGARYLVLNGDVKTRSSAVLRHQHAVEMVGNSGAKVHHPLAADAKGRAAAKIHHTFQKRARRDGVCGKIAKQIARFIQHAGRQGMEKRDMRAEEIAMRRKVHFPEPVRPRLHVGGEQSGNDQRGMMG